MQTIYQKFEIQTNNKYIIVYINSFNNSLVRTEAPLPRLDPDDIRLPNECDSYGGEKYKIIAFFIRKGPHPTHGHCSSRFI